MIRVAEDFTLSALAEIAGMPKRAVQLWADAGVIKANPSTVLAGSGVHRKFKREEAIVACVVAPFAKQKMAIGALKSVGNTVRLYLRQPQSAEALRRSALGDGNYFLVAYWVPEKSGELVPEVFNLVGDMDPTQSFFDVVGKDVHVLRGGKGVDLAPIKIDVIPLNEVLRSLPREV
jgi:hypothetical protein